jgi:23S rRNA pseudouridine2605 synthase
MRRRRARDHRGGADRGHAADGDHGGRHQRSRGSRRDAQTPNTTWWVVRLAEGRTRQIREMFLRIGHPVQKLRRIAIGPLRDPRLAVGAWRELSDDEVRRLGEACGTPRGPARPRETVR